MRIRYSLSFAEGLLDASETEDESESGMEGERETRDKRNKAEYSMRLAGVREKADERTDRPSYIYEGASKM